MNKLTRFFGLVLAAAFITSAGAQSRKTEVWDFGGVEEKGAVKSGQRKKERVL